MDGQTTVAVNVSKLQTTSEVSESQVMTEKWLLVLLIVGSTSLVFLICFPIDFYLYRRRKRLAREHKNTPLPWYKSQTPARAAQVHATVTLTKVAAEIDFEEMNDKDRKAYRAQRGMIRFLSRIRKKRNRQKLDQESFNDTKSENDSNCRILPSPETSHTDDVENASKNIFENLNDDVFEAQYKDFNKIGKENRSRRKTYGDVESYYSNSEEIIRPTRKYSSTVYAWGENDELVGREIKQLNYGAFEPLENMTSFASEVNTGTCYTIPVRGRRQVFVEAAISESNTDIEPADNQTEGSHVHSFHYTEEEHQDVVVECKNTDTKSNIEEERINDTLIVNKENSDDCKTDSEGNSANSETGLISSDNKLNDVDMELELKQYQNLLRSQSDQCLSNNTQPIYTNYKTKKKVHIVTPTGTNITNIVEQFNIDEDNSGSHSNRHSASLEEHSFVPNACTQDNMKNNQCLKKPFESMPELKLFHKK